MASPRREPGDSERGKWVRKTLSLRDEGVAPGLSFFRSEGVTPGRNSVAIPNKADALAIQIKHVDPISGLSPCL